MNIAVIGGGFSGLLTAYLLQKKGHQITVYERLPNLGGHCQSFSFGEHPIEMGTVFSFNAGIKSLLDELGTTYAERLTFRNFVNAQLEKIELLSIEEAPLLMRELTALEQVLQTLHFDFKTTIYGDIPEALMSSLYDFLSAHHLPILIKLLSPHLSSYGFGDIRQIPAYYGLCIFDRDTICSFIKGEKLLFITNGISDLIQKLARKLSDVRLNLAVTNIAPVEEGVMVFTDFDVHVYDQVFITTPLPPDAIQSPIHQAFMAKLKTHDYITCAFEVAGKHLVTTYFTHQMGEKNKLQFFHTYACGSKNVLVAYAYGASSPEVVDAIRQELTLLGISVTHLIDIRSWHIFPHFSIDTISSQTYLSLKAAGIHSHIHFSGALVSKPSIAHLYASIKTQLESF